MKSYTYFFIMLAALALSSAILADTVKQYPASQKTQTIRYTERGPEGVYKEDLPQQPERRVSQPLREEDRYRREGYYDNRGHWHYTDEDYGPDGDHYYRRGHWHDGRGRVGDSRVFPWNW